MKCSIHIRAIIIAMLNFMKFGESQSVSANFVSFNNEIV